MNYNNLPFWVQKHLERMPPRNADVRFDFHYIKRRHRGLVQENITQTVRTGKVILFKSLWPGKITFELYFGKENVTYTVVTYFKQKIILVKTAWQRNGR